MIRSTPLVRKSELRRARPLPRSRIRRFAARPPAISDRELDDLAREVTFKRDAYRCIRCSKPSTEATPRKDGTISYRGIQWAHVYTRGIKSLRWDPDNLMTLCPGCHLWWHHEPANSMPWFELAFPARFERIRLIRQIRIRTIDRSAIRMALQLAHERP